MYHFDKSKHKLDRISELFVNFLVLRLEYQCGGCMFTFKLLRNQTGGSLIQVIVVSAIVSVVVLGMTKTTQTMLKNANSVDSRVSSTSVSLSLKTYLSSQRLCMEAVGSNQTINPASSKPEIKFEIASLGRIEKDSENQKLSAEFESVFLDDIQNQGVDPGGLGQTYEGLLKYAMAEKRTVVNDNPNAVITVTTVSTAHQATKTVGRFKFVLDASNKIVRCHIKKI